MYRQSAGLLVYKTTKIVEVLLVHPGGPFFKNKDEGAWSLPKGEYADEDPLSVAKREFFEETGNKIDGKDFIPLNPEKLKSGKVIHAWAIKSEHSYRFIESNTFEIEWPPKSGKKQTFPEVDKAEWFNITDARRKLNPSQVSFLDQLETILNYNLP